MTARPARGAGFALTQDLLTAVGIDADLEGGGRRKAEDVDVLRAWLHAHRIRVVVVTLANNLGARDAFDTLCTVVGDSGSDLLLVADEHDDERLAALLVSRQARFLPPADVDAYLTGATSPTAAEGPPHAVDFPVVLPRVDFFRFRARCRDVLPPDQFRMVDDLYRWAFAATLAADPGTADDGRQLFDRLVDGHDNPGMVTTVVRAVQAATFTLGRHTKVSMAELMRAVAGGRHRRMTPEEVRRLRAYRTPWRSCAAVLYDADLTVERMTCLTVGDVDADGTLGVPHAPMHPDALLYLRAQRALRRIQEAGDDRPLLDRSFLYVSRALRRLGTDLCLPSQDANAATEKTRSERWQYSHGLTLVPLTGNAVTEQEESR